MKTSEEINELSTSLIMLQSELSNIGKDSKGYGYNYTSLEKLLEYVRPLMTKNGLGLIQTPTNIDNRIGVTTRLIHKSGQFIEDTLLMDKSSLAKMNDYQVAGSIITYFRRYAVSSILGIASDEDVDAVISQQQPKQPQVQQVQLISQEQVLELEHLISEHKRDKVKLLAYYKINKLDDIPLSNYATIKAQITAEKK